MAAEEVGVPGGFEVGVGVAAPFVEFVLVGVEEGGVGAGGEGVGDLGERVRGEFVVVVEEGDEVALGESEGGVGGAGNVAAAGEAGDEDARIGGGEVAEDGLNVGRGGGVVGDAELPARVGLGAHAFDGAVEPACGGVVHGHEHGDEGTAGGRGGGGIEAGVCFAPEAVVALGEGGRAPPGEEEAAGEEMGAAVGGEGFDLEEFEADADAKFGAEAGGGSEGWGVGPCAGGAGDEAAAEAYVYGCGGAAGVVLKPSGEGDLAGDEAGREGRDKEVMPHERGTAGGEAGEKFGSERVVAGCGIRERGGRPGTREDREGAEEPGLVTYRRKVVMFR